MLMMKPFFTLYFVLFIQSISYQLRQNLFQMICFYCWWWFNLQVQSKCLKWEIHQDFPNLSGGIVDYSVCQAFDLKPVLNLKKLLLWLFNLHKFPFTNHGRNSSTCISRELGKWLPPRFNSLIFSWC